MKALARPETPSLAVLVEEPDHERLREVRLAFIAEPTANSVLDCLDDMRHLMGHDTDERIFFVPSREVWDEVMADLEVEEEYTRSPGRTTTISSKGHDDRVFVSLGAQCDGGPLDAYWPVVVDEARGRAHSRTSTRSSRPPHRH